VTAKRGGSVHGASEPVLFWAAMMLPAFGLIAAIVLLVGGN
jgi:hypothetical protein